MFSPRVRSLFFCASVWLLAGCSTNEAPSEPPAAGGAPVATPAPGAPAAAPMAGGDPMAPLSPTPELDQKISEAEKSGDKKAIGAAYAARGTYHMLDELAGARVKYRAALEDYRKSLASDPKNAEATRYKKQIEDIYRSMGRPIPGEEFAAPATKP